MTTVIIAAVVALALIAGIAIALGVSTSPPRSRVDLGLADRSCKSCYGTGVKGRQVVGDKRIRLICHCVAKATVEREQGISL